MRFIGIDLHKREVEVCALDGTGNVDFRRSVPCDRDALGVFARDHLRTTDAVVLEATTNTWVVAELLAPFVGRVAVGNPLQIRAIAQAKVKTDTIDAEVLAQLLRCDYLPGVWQPDAGTPSLRHRTAVRAALVADLTRRKNRIHSVLAGQLVRPPVPNLFTKPGVAWLRDCPLPPDARSTVDRFLRLYDEVERELEELDIRLQAEAHGNEAVRTLMTLPGVAHGVALSLVAALGDVSRFRDGDHAASYLGLVPVVRQSGGKCYRGPITKAGNTQARAVLIQAAQHAAAHPGPLGAFFRRLRKRKPHTVAVVATARKLVTIAFLMLKNKEPYRYAKPERVRQKLRAVERAAEQVAGPTPPEIAPARAMDAGNDRLNRTYRRSGLPTAQGPGEWSAGERRALNAAGVTDFAEQVHAPPPRRGPKPKVANRSGK
jgi:transposase